MCVCVCVCVCVGGVCHFLLETTKICFGSTKLDIFYREKSYFTPRKNRENLLCPPLKNIPLTPLRSREHINVQYFRQLKAKGILTC